MPHELWAPPFVGPIPPLSSLWHTRDTMKHILPWCLAPTVLGSCAPATATSVSKPARVESTFSPPEARDKPAVPPARSVTPSSQASIGQPIPCAFERVLEGDFRAIAVEAPPYVAALSTERVYLHNARGWHNERLPGDIAQVQVFLGRDFRPRMLGTRALNGNLDNAYLRWTEGGIRAARDELGRLARSTKGAFIAVLGIEDPEMVCVADDVCILKRLSGWATLPAPNDLTHVAISEGVGYALAGQRFLQAEARGWVEAGPQGTWEGATALSVGKQQAVVLDAKGYVHTLSEGAEQWQSEPSPIIGASAIWAEPSEAVWIGGKTLAQRAHGAWRHADAVGGPIHAISGRGGCDVWLATAQGLLRGAPSE